MTTKTAVSNLGAEELNFLKYVRQTREDTRRDANAMFSTSHQTRERDQELLNKLFVQTPAVITTANMLIKNASAEEKFETFEKIKVAYNVFNYFEQSELRKTAESRYPELRKVANSRSAVSLKPTPSLTSKTGPTSVSSPNSGSAK